MLTEFVLADITVGGLVVMTSPLLFQGLLELRYPPSFRGEAPEALAGGASPKRPVRTSRGRPREIPPQAPSPPEAIRRRSQSGA